MSKDRREKLKGRRGTEPFLQIPSSVLHSKAYGELDGWGVKLLVDIASQFRGHNNGDLCAAFSILKEKSWRSKGTLHKALSKLLEVGLIEQTRQGGRNRCSLYAITWRPIDECKGKLDVRPTRAPSALYLDINRKAREN